MNKKTKKMHICEFLEILDKKGCKETERKIKAAFDLLEEPEYIIEKKEDFSKLPRALRPLYYTLGKPGVINLLRKPFGFEAIKFLKEKQAWEKADSDPFYKKWHKKMEGFQDALKNILKYANDPEIQRFLLTQAERETEGKVSPQVILVQHDKAFRHMNHLSMDVWAVLYEEKKKGRPSLDVFYDFIYEMAEIYEILSGKKFTVFRNRETAGVNMGKYSPSTGGHRFAFKATQFLHEVAREDKIYLEYTDKNIYIACEKAQKRLKEKRATQILANSKPDSGRRAL